jgi:hypothetical protein
LTNNTLEEILIYPKLGSNKLTKNMTPLAFIGPQVIIVILLIIPVFLIIPILALIDILKNEFTNNN